MWVELSVWPMVDGGGGGGGGVFGKHVFIFSILIGDTEMTQYTLKNLLI